MTVGWIEDGASGRAPGLSDGEGKVHVTGNIKPALSP